MVPSARYDNPGRIDLRWRGGHPACFTTAMRDALPDPLPDPLPDQGPLAAGDVHVWTVKLDHAHADASATAMLDPHERARAGRFTFERDRTAFTLGHAALREILASYLDVGAADVTLTTGAHGKPELDPRRHPTNLRFNLSGSGERALIAVACGRDVGVDVEQVRPMNDLDGIKEIVLSTAERAAFALLHEADRLGFFLDAWTRKEAYLKALGEGLARPLSKITCGMLTGAESIRDVDYPPASERWFVTGWRSAGYHAALAVATPTGQITLKSWPR